MNSDDSKVTVIQKNSDLGAEEARLALDLADGDIKQALEMIDYVEKSFFTLQVKFETEGANKVYGLVSLIANGKEGKQLDLSVITTYDREVLETEVGINNKVFIETINEAKENSGTTYDSDVHEAFTEKLNSAKIFQIYSNIKDDHLLEIEGLIRDLLNPIFNKEIDLELGTKFMTKNQLERESVVNLDPEENDEKSAEESEEDEERKLSIYLKTAPVISAVDGVKVDRLSVGERILVRIVDRREIGRYLADLISTDAKGIAIGKITDIYLNDQSDRYTLTLEFGPKIYGKLLIEGEIKIALADEVDVEEVTRDSDNVKQLELEIPWPLVGLFIGLVIILIVLLQFI
ncbi:MAG: hypothetical protein ACQEQI_02860 [Bacillota bacterium]